VIEEWILNGQEINIPSDRLFTIKKPWGAFFAEDYNTTTNRLPDTSGNNRGDIIKGGAGTITKTSGSGNGTTASINYISGDTTTNLTFPNGSLPHSFTIASLTRYTNPSANQQRILQATNINFVHGHVNIITATLSDTTGSRRGICYYDPWNTQQTNIGNKTDWLSCIGKNAGSTPGNILVDGIAVGNATGGIGGSNALTINTGSASAQISDYAMSFVMVWDQILTDDEMIAINNMVNVYKITGVSMKEMYLNSGLFANSIGGSGGGGSGGYLVTSGGINGISFNPGYSNIYPGFSGTTNFGGNGASALSNIPYTSLITGSSYQVGQGGSGAGSNTTPVIKTIPGSGGDGNGGLGTNGIVIIKIPLDTCNIKFDGFIYAANIIDLNTGISSTSSTTIELTSNQLYSTIIQTSNNLQNSINNNRSWITSNNNIYYSNISGNVGIGTNNPNYKLHVIGDMGIAGNIIPTINSNFNLGSSNNRWKEIHTTAININNIILTRNNSNNLEIRDATTNNLRSISASGFQINDINNNSLSFNFSNGQLIYNSNGSNYPSIPFQNLSQIVYSNQLFEASNNLISYTNTQLNKTRDVIEDFTSTGLINIYRDNVEYSYNYELTRKTIAKGTYQAIFSGSNITFNGETNNSYTVIRDTSTGIIINPIVWLKFDDSTNIGLDSSGNSYNHTNNNTVGTIVGVKGTLAATFNGTNQYLRNTSLGTFFNGKSFTISFWSYRNSGTANTFILSTPNAGVNTGTLHIGYISINAGANTSSIRFGFYSNDLDYNQNTIDLNIWVHLTFVYNNSNKLQSIYKNGILVATRTSTADLNVSSTNFNIGTWNLGGADYWNGNLDDFRIYDQVLTADQVLELYRGRIRVYYPITINADLITQGTSNRIITNDTYSRAITFTSNVNVLGNYQLNGCNIPFSLIPYTSTRATNSSFSYNSSSNNFGYYSFSTNGSINFTKQTSCDLLIVGF